MKRIRINFPSWEEGKGFIDTIAEKYSINEINEYEQYYECENSFMKATCVLDFDETSGVTILVKDDSKTEELQEFVDNY